MTLSSITRRAGRIWDYARHEARVAMHRPRWMPLEWQPLPDGPIERVEPAGVQLGNRLYVIAGFHSLDTVLSVIDVFDLDACAWVERIELPTTIAQTHCGNVPEGDRHIYFIAGQVGPQCSPATRDCLSFDVTTREWTTLPPLPKARYAPITRLWHGRLHVIAGSKEDRTSPAHEHWSLAVKDGRALEPEWRVEPPIPVAGPHRCSAAIGDTLYVLGSQHFDRPPIPGDPQFTCDWKAPAELFFNECFALDRGASAWRRLADIPIAVTHSEFSTFAEDGKIVVLGGAMKKITYCDLIQVYDIAADRWSIVGRLPWRNKGFVSARHDGWLYVFVGQRNAGRFDLSYGPVLKGGYRARFAL